MGQENTQITLNTVSYHEDKLVVFPSKIEFNENYVKFDLRFKLDREIKITTGDDILDKLSPQTEVIKKTLVEVVYIDKEKNLLAVKGAVPGVGGRIVEIRG